MEEVINEIENSDIILDHFGYWPSFHDAEILSVCLDRNFDEGLPKLLLKIYAFEMTDKIKGRHYQLIKHCLIEIEFEGIVENEIDGFNHQNAVQGLDFGKEESLITCKIDPAYGIEGFISARKVRVKDLETLTKDPKGE